MCNCKPQFWVHGGRGHGSHLHDQAGDGLHQGRLPQLQRMLLCEVPHCMTHGRSSLLLITNTACDGGCKDARCLELVKPAGVLRGVLCLVAGGDGMCGWV